MNIAIGQGKSDVDETRPHRPWFDRATPAALPSPFSITAFCASADSHSSECAGRVAALRAGGTRPERAWAAGRPCLYPSSPVAFSGNGCNEETAWQRHLLRDKSSSSTKHCAPGSRALPPRSRNTFDGVWMNLGVDRFMQTTPTRFICLAWDCGPAANALTSSRSC